MPAPKCQCSNCNALVSNWIGDKCIRCYNNEVIQPTIIKYDRMLLDEGTFHLREVSRLREVELENNRFWASVVAEYRGRFEVRMVDKAKYYWLYVLTFFSNLWTRIRFTLGVVGLVGPWSKWSKK